jgi:hypothetical protein
MHEQINRRAVTRIIELPAQPVLALRTIVTGMGARFYGIEKQTTAAISIQD